MADLRVSLEGFAQWKARLKKLDRKGSAAVLSDVLKKAAFKTQELSTQRYMRTGGGPPVPRFLTVRTGTLARSIGVDFGGLPRRAVVQTNSSYGPRHELGLSGMPKRPFLFPAADDVGREFLDRFFEDRLAVALR